MSGLPGAPAETTPAMMNNLTALLRNNIGLLALLLVSFLVYAPGLKGDFVVDDTSLIRDNSHIRDLGEFTRYFTAGLGANSEHEDNSSPIYRPLILVAIALGHGVWGNSPVAYHLALLLLHLANTVLVYALIRKLAAAPGPYAAFGAAVFALHPARAESVAWLSGLPDPLAVFFLLLGLFAHRAYSARSKRWHYLALSLLCFQLALWSKEVAIFFPLAVAAHDLLHRKKVDWPAAALHGILVAGYLAMRTLALGEAGKTGAFDWSRLPRALDLTLGYGEMLAFPVRIPFYIEPPDHSVSSLLGWAGLALIAVLAGYAWRVSGTERRKALALAAVWAAGFSWQAVLLMFYLDGYYSARFLYVPAAGMAVFAAALCGHLSERHERLRAPLAGLCLLILSGYGYASWKEIPAWRSNETIYRKVVESAPDSASGFSGLGHFYLEQENLPEAERNFLAALQKERQAPQVRVSSLVALGILYGMTNKLEQSERYLKEAVEIEPGNSEALAGLGNLAWMRGQVPDAISWYERALAARPGNYQAAMNLAMAYEQSGQTGRAAAIRRGMGGSPRQ
jgi:tetratricopeptide (TPR) repeat protein